MFKIGLKNSKSFQCDGTSTIFDAAKDQGIILEHSCLSARCRSCIVKVLKGKTTDFAEELVLSEKEKGEGFILSCNAKPISNLELDIEDLGDVKFSKSRTLPCKIDSISRMSPDVVKVILRLPPKTAFEFIPGQYINIIKGNSKRSYSIANLDVKDSKLEFLIKKYEKGLMSKFWFEEAKQNDLLRLEGPLGTFFYRNSSAKNIVFLATGTGIAPVKSILEQIYQNQNDIQHKKILVIWGGRYPKDIFWQPKKQENVKFIPVLSRSTKEWKGKTGYVQNVLMDELIDLKNSQVYACGSNAMIESAYKLLTQSGLPINNFYSDAFVCSN